MVIVKFDAPPNPLLIPAIFVVSALVTTLSISFLELGVKSEIVSGRKLRACKNVFVFGFKRAWIFILVGLAVGMLNGFGNKGIWGQIWVSTVLLSVSFGEYFLWLYRQKAKSKEEVMPNNFFGNETDATAGFCQQIPVAMDGAAWNSWHMKHICAVWLPPTPSTQR